MGKVQRVCHVTSVHSSDDARIFHKECISLSQAGYEVWLVAPGASRTESGIKVIGCGDKPEKIYLRATRYAKMLVNTALELDCDIYHLHDPELLLYVDKLKQAGKKVIFDSHEDYYFDSRYFPEALIGVMNGLYRAYEKYTVSKIDGLICCYKKTQERLIKVCKNTAMVYNFPLLNLGDGNQKIIEGDAFNIGYAGGISSTWNHEAVLEAMEGLDGVKYIIAGNCDPTYLAILKSKKAWNKVEYKGKLPFDMVKEEIYGKTSVGIALLTYIKECNGKEGNLSNTKLFEMMDASLPVIATDFDLWKDVVEKNKCGICVSPYDVEGIRKAIVYLKENPGIREAMGNNAKKAIMEKYNWTNESKKLLEVYQRLG